MDIKVKSYLDRAENELVLANANFQVSTDQEIKNKLGVSIDKTFFNNVISESYYAIFYSTKAFLISLGIKTEPPEEHKKTYKEFKKIVESKKLDEKLAEIYEEESNKAETLLKIFFDEKRNRGRFTYNINANANKPFAEQSIRNAKLFASTIRYLIENLDGVINKKYKGYL